MMTNAKRSLSSLEQGELDRMVGYQLHMVDLIALRGARDALADRDTTPAAVSAMLLIHDQPGCDQSTVARLLSINRSSAAKFIDKLEAKGHVMRSEGRDKRSNGLRLTAAGERHLLEAVALLNSANAALCESLSPREQAELLRLLGKILKQAGRAAAATASPTLIRPLRPDRKAR